MAAAEGSNRLTAEQLFDDVGPAYESAFAGLSTQAAAIEWLINQLAEKKPAKCLDIGCGTGRPTCSELADAGHDVLGIDISGAMIEDASKKVPNAKFEKVDMASYNPSPSSFDAITVFFSMIASVTQDQIRQNFRNIYQWLKPGGVFVFATVPVAGNNLEIKWMGRPIVVSSLEAEDAVESIRKAGFDVEHHAVSSFTPKAVEAGICTDEDVWEEPHLFVYARKQ
jgi:ubiquinone/menaquinone biosynthesis C-methylase UbiE